MKRIHPIKERVVRRGWTWRRLMAAWITSPRTKVVLDAASTAGNNTYQA